MDRDNIVVVRKGERRERRERGENRVRKEKEKEKKERAREEGRRDSVCIYGVCVCGYVGMWVCGYVCVCVYVLDLSADLLCPCEKE